jgi:HPt (histidine-containing phosphotransfer) domain-containing protein
MGRVSAKNVVFRGLCTELAGLFFEDVPVRLAALRGASDAGDAATLERTAHALKRSCGTLGARKMAETAKLLEEAGRRLLFCLPRVPHEVAGDVDPDHARPAFG